LNIEDSNAIVTGSSRGIGRAIALELAGRGGNIVVCCQSRIEDARSVAAEIEGMGRRAAVAQADLSTEEGARSVVETCTRELGGVDILVNNTGMRELAPIHSLAAADLERMMRVNLFSCFYMAKHVVELMLEAGKGGCIVNLSSIAAELGLAGGTAYAASKAGVNGFTICLAREVARHGIRVNGVAPGYVETEMVDWITAEVKDQMLPRIPMRRLGTAEEVAKAVAFLIQDATYMTGQTLVMDGGILID
jgi:3-oxoacyl-[acyl-carrier protein] reductase